MQLDLFPNWQETTKTARILAMALQNAQTPIKPAPTEKQRIRPVIDNGLKTELDRWIADRVGR